MFYSNCVFIVMYTTFLSFKNEQLWLLFQNFMCSSDSYLVFESCMSYFYDCSTSWMYMTCMILTIFLVFIPLPMDGVMVCAFDQWEILSLVQSAVLWIALKFEPQYNLSFETIAKYLHTVWNFVTVQKWKANKRFGFFMK